MASQPKAKISEFVIVEVWPTVIVVDYVKDQKVTRLGVKTSWTDAMTLVACGATAPLPLFVTAMDQHGDQVDPLGFRLTAPKPDLDVKVGDMVTCDTPQGILTGKVIRIDSRIGEAYLRALMDVPGYGLPCSVPLPIVQVVK